MPIIRAPCISANPVREKLQVWRSKNRLRAHRCNSGASSDRLSSVSSKAGSLGFQGVHHVAVIVSNLEQSLEFYCGIL
eukprot:scaffold652762_cov52-Prasinocladus_malaysianus.AAC.1